MPSVKMLFYSMKMNIMLINIRKGLHMYVCSYLMASWVTVNSRIPIRMIVNQDVLCLDHPSGGVLSLDLFDIMYFALVILFCFGGILGTRLPSVHACVLPGLVLGWISHNFQTNDFL